MHFVRFIALFDVEPRSARTSSSRPSERHADLRVGGFTQETVTNFSLNEPPTSADGFRQPAESEEDAVVAPKTSHGTPTDTTKQAKRCPPSA